jgi:nicotinamidase-related amidase
MKRHYHLLIIDPQNDFCDLPAEAAAPHMPALPVEGAHQDMLRLASLIEQGGAGLSAITVTLDSHHRYDIAHPTFWHDADGMAPGPFTQISAADVRAGRFRPRDAGALPRVLSYLDKLEEAGRYQLMVWPVHCEIGSWGHNVHDAVRRAYNAWEEQRHAVVAKVVKGSNPWTEHYSAVMAEVPDPADPASQMNRELIASLSQADTIYIAGEAGSHCVKATTEHIADRIDPRKLVLVTDCMSPVTGFEPQYLGFAQEMQRRGARLATTGEVLPDWLANAGH